MPGVSQFEYLMYLIKHGIDHVHVMNGTYLDRKRVFVIREWEIPYDILAKSIRDLLKADKYWLKRLPPKLSVDVFKYSEVHGGFQQTPYSYYIPCVVIYDELNDSIEQLELDGYQLWQESTIYKRTGLWFPITKVWPKQI